MRIQSKISLSLLLLFLLTTPLWAKVSGQNTDTIKTSLQRLQAAYPEYITAVTQTHIIWIDGSKMLAVDSKANKSQQEKLNHPSLLDQVDQIYYSTEMPRDLADFDPQDDAGRIRYEPFFLKMYGETRNAVIKNLTLIFWMPKVFGKRYPLLVTTINHVDKKVLNISNDLEKLVSNHPEYIKFLQNPGGTFKWRLIANTNRISTHSFGMTLDINSTYSNYWQWDLKNNAQEIDEENSEFDYQNDIPWEIIPIFEKYGFIWGGKWRHYDTMHFEYRPELFITTSL